MLKTVAAFTLGVVLPVTLLAAPTKARPTADAVSACYAAVKDNDAEAQGKCLNLELDMVQGAYKDVTDRVASLAKALDKPTGTRTRWNKFILAGQSFDTFVKRECDFVANTTKGRRQLEVNAELSCKIGYYRLRTSILTNRHLSQSRF
ncbi:DUF1311 domain-containing protein [Sutterella sp.]|uniref:DUF1311 domain-containing protein n=1 Tax=Sutterella sp. TaxID=1981025 RepID=UPI0026E0679F|nr:DUF1311 domain-containing protein [Sutterella sp.]MDO5532864.1 DUF1311 domain-containing protein [Sutterella sp.]